LIVLLSQRLKEQNAIEQKLRDEIALIQQQKLDGERRYNVKVSDEVFFSSHMSESLCRR
jgi:hypothetical protein